LASAGKDGKIRLAETATGKQIALLPGSKWSVYCLAFAPDGKTLASGSGDDADYDSMVRLWDVGTGREVRRLEHPKSVRSVAFSQDGKVIATACNDGGARL